MITADNIKVNKSCNDNIHTTNPKLLKCLRDVKAGRKKSYLFLAQIYEGGHGVKPDSKKALELYELYYEAYKKLVPADFDVIVFLIELGNKYSNLKLKDKAEECYFNAFMHIVEICDNDEKKKSKLIKQYKLEKLLKELE